MNRKHLNSLPNSAKYGQESKSSTFPGTRTVSCRAEYMRLWKKGCHSVRSSTRVMHTVKIREMLDADQFKAEAS
jgi:hypothetical protein